ncbi:hypothetical protein, partial [Escherichia coli]
TGAPTKVLAPDTAGKFYPNQKRSYSILGT